MSAEMLRKAAREIRNDFEGFDCNGCAVPEPFMVAVADLLDAEAAKQTPTTHLAVTFDGAPMFPVDPHALAVARAYLGAT